MRAVRISSRHGHAAALPRDQRVLHGAKRSNRDFSIAMVTPEGQPHVTPIGHVFFREGYASRKMTGRPAAK